MKKLDHLITLFKITQNMRPRDLKTKVHVCSKFLNTGQKPFGETLSTLCRAVL